VFAALGIGHMEDHASAHAEQIDLFFAIVCAVINPFDCEGIAKRFDCLIESDAMIAPIGGNLVIIPFECIIVPWIY